MALQMKHKTIKYIKKILKDYCVAFWILNFNKLVLLKFHTVEELLI